MKKRSLTIIKILSFTVLLSILFSLTGCGRLNIEEWFAKQKPSAEEKSYNYCGMKVLDSYDELICAWQIIKNNGNNIASSVYAVDSDLGDEYKVFYNFYQQGTHTYYPIGFQEFFETESNGLFTTKIYLLNHSSDECEHISTIDESGVIDPSFYNHNLSMSTADEEYEHFMGYMEHPMIEVSGYNGFEIEDSSLVSFEEYEERACLYGYLVYYGETKILEITSCIALDENILTKIVDNVKLLK